MSESTPESVKRLARTQLLTYEQLSASRSIATAPLQTVSPVPPAIERAVQCAVETPANETLLIRPRTAAISEAVERSAVLHSPAPDRTRPPLSDPAYRMPNHFRADESGIPARSRLTPSQRREAHRTAASGDRPARLAYVTYTVDSAD